MTTQELMQPFCAVDEILYYLNYINKEGDYLFASNGHIMVSMPDDGTVEINKDINSKDPNNFEKVLARDTWPQDGFIPFSIPDTELKKCNKCCGTGKHPEKMDCDDCDGNGWFNHGRHEYDCKECDGDGKINADSDKIVDCEDCKGTGVGYTLTKMPDGRLFNFQYLKKIEALPNVTYLPDTKLDGYMRFKFEGGCGLLMPCRQ